MNPERPAWSRESLVLGLRGAPPPVFSPQWTLEGSTGRGIRVAVIDSGIEAHHPLLGGAVDVDAGVAFSADATGGVQRTDGPHHDVYGHGTAVAGIIHALAPDARLISVRVLDETLRGRAAAFHAGLAWAIEEGIEVINLSLGAGHREWALAFHELCDRGYFANSFIVTAAANSHQEAFPSLFASVASVAANTTTDPLRFHVNPNPPTEFLARGMNVEVPWINGTTQITTGNSFAAPHIAGFAALIRSKHPDLRPFQVKTALWAASANAREADGRASLPGIGSRPGAAGSPAPQTPVSEPVAAAPASATGPDGPDDPGDHSIDELRLLMDGYEVGPVVRRDPWGPVHEASRDGYHVLVRRLDCRLAANSAVLARFVASVRIMAELRHPHLLPVLELREHPDFAAVVTPRCRSDLRARLASGPFEPPAAVAAVVSVLLGLAPAHARGVYHGDLRPDNACIDGAGRVVVTDVGLSAALSSDIRTSAAPHDPGSWSYLAPEQLEGAAIGPFTDVHAAGLLLFELLTGELPFPPVSSLGSLVRQRASAVARSLGELAPDLPGDLVRSVDRAVSTDPASRPPSVSEMARGLAGVALGAFGPGWTTRQPFRFGPKPAPTTTNESGRS